MGNRKLSLSLGPKSNDNAQTIEWLREFQNFSWMTMSSWCHSHSSPIIKWPCMQCCNVFIFFSSVYWWNNVRLSRWKNKSLLQSILRCVCVFVFFHRKGLSWLNKTINVIPEFRSTIVCCGNIYVSSAFVSAAKIIIERTLI